MRICQSRTLLLGLVACAAGAVQAFSPWWAATRATSGPTSAPWTGGVPRTRLRAAPPSENEPEDTVKNKDDADDQKNLVAYEDMDLETSLVEQQQSNKVWNSLMAPYAIGGVLTDVITKLGWTFVLVGFLLEAFGYSYMIRDGQLTIDTLDNRQFQEELTRGIKESARNLK
jgi:hypothetical protein